MNKPVTIEIMETKANIVNVVNTAKLPAWILRDIFKDLTAQLTELAAQQEQKEAQEWAEYQKKKAEQDKEAGKAADEEPAEKEGDDES